MSFLAKIERAIEEIVEGIFRKAREATHPIEIGRYLLREMEDEKRISVSRTYVPNRYRVRMHARDVEYLGPLARTVSRELAGHVVSRARRQGYSFVGQVEVEFVVDEGARPGDIKVDGFFVEESEESASRTTVHGGDNQDATRRSCAGGEGQDQTLGARALAEGVPEESSRTRVSGRTGVDAADRDGPGRPYLVLRCGTGEERVFPLGDGKVTIGRSGSCDIVIENAGVSRRHAEIVREGGRFYVVDLGSTNGTYVNGRKVSKQLLADGDLVNFGRVAARFKEA
ncbi:MAG: DUF3662 and FHA domain-containing protein [Bacillota bacterium]|nr:DUF3662 and FHA domain-containing protein [Bacillota bacterium]